MLDEDIRVLLEGHPPTTSDLPVQQVLNVDLLDVAVIGDPIVPAFEAAPFELPQKLHHLMVETNDRDDVGAAFDRTWATDLAIPNGFGRHDNDGMFSFYVASPARFAVEVGHGARTIGEDWDDSRHHRASAWGHQPLRRRATAGPPP
jgi:3,4-dihydroxy-9,10-secoandrosta-1,3,5(10)-triene-9,17-dione 4,5-dioxygenase